MRARVADGSQLVQTSDVKVAVVHLLPLSLLMNT